MTISGVHRGEQRKIYDERRRDILPKNGITLIEFSYSDFNHDRQKLIIRDQKCKLPQKQYVLEVDKVFIFKNVKNEKESIYPYTDCLHPQGV